MMQARATRPTARGWAWSAVCAAALAGGCAGGGWLERPLTAELPIEGPQNAYPTALRPPGEARTTAYESPVAPAAVMLPEASAPTAAATAAEATPTPAVSSRVDRQQTNMPVLAVIPPQYVTHAPPHAVAPQPAAAILPTAAPAFPSPPAAAPVGSEWNAAAAVSRAGHYTISDEPSSQGQMPAPAALAPAGAASLEALAQPAIGQPGIELPSTAQADAKTDQPVDLDRARREWIDALEAEIRRRREANTADEELPRLEQQLRLAYVAAGRLDDAVAAVESLDEPQREAYRDLMFGLGVWLSPDEAKRAPLRTAKVLHSLRDATTDLAANSKLELRNLVFCERVDYFGWYSEFPRKEFQPKQQVILYVEVQNFAAEHKGAAGYETELHGSYEILDASGQIVASRKLPADKEICRNYRRDYFLAYRLYMPDSIAPGHYRLELTIEDLKARGKYQGRKLGEGMIEFTIR